MTDDKSMATLIEDKLVELMTEATITDVSTHVVQGIDRVMTDYDRFEYYPRILVYVDDDGIQEQQISPRGLENKQYTANVMLLCYNTDYSELIVQRDTVLRRIREILRVNKRLGNLADNTSDNTEAVWNSYIKQTHYAKAGAQGSYQALTWVEMTIETSMV